LCFECHRAERERLRSIRAAAELNTASEARFQDALPFEPVDQVRLERLRAERAADRVASATIAGASDTRRHRAIIAARRALDAAHGVGCVAGAKSPEGQAFMIAMHAAELQLPVAWIPFVVSR
jgi:hypothetical protein